MRMMRLVAACVVVLVPCGALAQSAAGRPTRMPATPAPLTDSIPAVASAVIAESRVPASWSDWNATKKGAVVGLVVGATCGILMGAVLCDGYHCAQVELATAAGLGVLGAGVGAGVGWLIDGGYQPGGTPRGIWPARTAARRVSVRFRF